MDGIAQNSLARSKVYDPKVALVFFTSGGEAEKIAKGNTILAENQKAQPLLFQRDQMPRVHRHGVDRPAKPFHERQRWTRCSATPGWLVQASRFIPQQQTAGRGR